MMVINCPECDIEIADDTVVCPGCSNLLDDISLETRVLEDATEHKLEKAGNLSGKIRLLSGILTILGLVAIVNGQKQGFPFLYGGLSIFIVSSISSWWFRKKAD